MAVRNNPWFGHRKSEKFQDSDVRQINRLAGEMQITLKTVGESIGLPYPVNFPQPLKVVRKGIKYDELGWELFDYTTKIMFWVNEFTRIVQEKYGWTYTTTVRKDTMYKWVKVEFIEDKHKVYHGQEEDHIQCLIWLVATMRRRLVVINKEAQK